MTQTQIHDDLAARDMLDATGYRRMRNVILVLTAFIVIFGSVMVFSSSTVLSYKNHGNAYSYGLRHLGSVAIGAVGMWLASRCAPRRWQQWNIVFAVATFGTLCFVLIRGAAIGGQRNWIRILGTTFQPSEVAKIAMILTLAYSLSANQQRGRTWKQIWISWIVITASLVGPVVLGGDFGTPLVMLPIALGVLFVAGVDLRFIGYTAGAAVFACIGMVMTKGYRMDRFSAWFDPFTYKSAAGYQAVHGRFALGGGGIFGEGLGSGREKWGALPAAHTDFILAATGEETGVAGAAAMVSALMALALTFYRLSMLKRDSFARYVCAGLAVWLGWQSLLNIAMVVGFAPVVGVTLPLVSFGGTSMIAVLSALGIGLSLCRPEES